MAHLSGYEGSMTYTGTSSDTNFDAEDTLNDLALESWTITQETDSFKVFAKSEAFKTTFCTRSRWSGTATYVVESGVLALNGRNMEIRGDGIAAHKQFIGTFITATGDSYSGTALVVGMNTEDPLDGPARITVDFKGDGSLSFTGS